MRSPLIAMATLILAIPGGAAGVNGLLWAATRPLVPALSEDAAFGWAIVVFYVLLTGVFWQWRLRPAVRSGELQGPVQMFLAAMLTVAFLCAIMVGLGASVRFGSSDDISPVAKPWIMLAMSLAGVIVSVQGLRQAGWYYTAYRQVAVLPTSKLRSAAAGAVEVHGTVVAQANDLPLVRKEDEQYFLRPFHLDDGTGAVAVHVPPCTEVNNEDHLVWVRYTEGVPVLAPGDRVRVLGTFDVMRDPPALAPWRPPGGEPLLGTPFGHPHVFAVAPDDERALHDELSAKARAWIGFSLVWLAGALLYGLIPWVG